MDKDRKFNPEGKKILVITAHPDDADFSAGGTLLKWTSQGAQASIVIATNGDKGSHNETSPMELAKVRKEEQLAASKFLGFENTWFLEYPDAHLEITQELKEKLVKLIREYKPDTVMSWDPTLVYSIERNMVNHPDHRAVGQAALDACYPLARDPLTFPEHEKNGLTSHCVADLFLFNSDKGTYFEDISDFLERKIELLKLHKSQIDPAKIVETVESVNGSLGSETSAKYAESFVHLSFEAD
jgi:LmbE family N-acetylglucosaminyl deacetylase